jgi:hypothetical protein
MTSRRREAAPPSRVRLDVTLPRDLDSYLRAVAVKWRLPLSTVIEAACRLFIEEGRIVREQSPIRARFRVRPGPLARIEERLSDEVADSIRHRGGRKLD